MMNRLFFLIKCLFSKDLKPGYVLCPKCYSKNVTEHTEFGLPAGKKYMCRNCNYIW